MISYLALTILSSYTDSIVLTTKVVKVVVVSVVVADDGPCLPCEVLNTPVWWAVCLATVDLVHPDLPEPLAGGARGGDGHGGVGAGQALGGIQVHVLSSIVATDCWWGLSCGGGELHLEREHGEVDDYREDEGYLVCGADPLQGRGGHVQTEHHEVEPEEANL